MLEDGAISSYGDLEGFLRVADPAVVKLPFESVLAQARRERAGGRDAAPERAAAEAEPTAPEPTEPDRAGAAAPRVPRRRRRLRRSPDPQRRDRVARPRARSVAVLGPNGSGKTTLFKVAMRPHPTRPTGIVVVDGEPTAERTVASLAAVFGYVFQSPSQMLFARTVREELLYGPRNLGSDEAGFDGLVADVLERVGLSDE